MSILHSQDVHLIDYLRVLYKHRLFVVLVFVVSVGCAAFTTSRMTPVYSSTSRILVDNDATIVDFPGVERRSILRIDTELLIMRSREVAEHAVRTRLRPELDRRDPEFEALVNRLMSSTGLDVLRNTIIVEMRVLADAPEKARDWCNAMAESYVDLNFQAKKKENAAGAEAIREQIDETKRQLEIDELRLREFQVEYGMVSDVSKTKEQDTLTGAGSSARAAASVKRTEAEQKYRALRNWFVNNDFTLAIPPDLAPSEIINELYTQLVKKRMEAQGLKTKYREEHPKVQAVQAEIDTLRRNFEGEVQNALLALKKQAEIYGDIDVAHKQQLGRDKGEILRENERNWEFDVLKRNVEDKKDVYRELVGKLSELNIGTSIVRNNVRIIERAKALPVPIRPNWRFNLLVGMVFGIGIAVAGAFFLEYLDKTLKTPDDIGRFLQLPVLAVVPLARSEMLRAPYETPALKEGGEGAVSA